MYVSENSEPLTGLAHARTVRRHGMGGHSSAPHHLAVLGLLLTQSSAAGKADGVRAVRTDLARLRRLPGCDSPGTHQAS